MIQNTSLIKKRKKYIIIKKKHEDNHKTINLVVLYSLRPSRPTFKETSFAGEGSYSWVHVSPRSSSRNHVSAAAIEAPSSPKAPTASDAP